MIVGTKVHLELFRNDNNRKSLEIELAIDAEIKAVFYTLQKAGLEVRMIKSSVHNGEKEIEPEEENNDDLRDLDTYCYIEVDLTQSEVSFKTFNEVLEQWRFEIEYC